MKQGSTDDPFADDAAADAETDTGPDGDAESSDETTRAGDSPSAPEDEDTGVSGGSGADSGGADESLDAAGGRTLPYIYKRDAVKEGRSQRPVYLREYNEERITELVDDVEALLNTEVTKTDVLEAAMETAIEHPELVVETLKSARYGYDWE